jgi:A/G-specific adenine glycosylase
MILLQPKSIQKKLLRWYDSNKRSLPWRENPTPYRVWISEMMLQQTQVETVLPYFKRFLKTFPNCKQLAQAPLDDVLKHWAGLGYYSRARNLHRAAGLIQEVFKGRFPRDLDQLKQLPGIGRYTAGAILSIAYNQAVPLLDGNVTRVLTRVLALKSPIEQSQTQNLLWQTAGEWVCPKRPGDFNQALMELGSQICHPRKPSCSKCPLQPFCQASLEGTPEKFPIKKNKVVYSPLHVALALIWDRGRLLIQKRPAKGHFGGLWEFPGGKVQPSETPRKAVFRESREELGVTVRVHQKRSVVPHAYTRFRVQLHPFDCRITERSPRPLESKSLRWCLPQELHQYAFPAANSKLFPNLIAHPFER